MIKRLFASLALVLCIFPAARAQVDFDRGGSGINELIAGSDAPAVSAPAPEKGWFSSDEQKPLAPKEWTVLVYVNGKNDLEASGLYNVNKMELTGSDSSLNIVAELGRMSGQQNDVKFDGDWTGSRRFYVTKDTDEEKIKSKVQQTFKNVDMGDWRHLVDFAKWGMKYYPAKHYALIVWNHGSGWITTKGLSANKGISYDFETKNHISTPELGAAMKEIGKVDILSYDACLMQMAEVLYEVKDYADYVVGSEETVPGQGFPYDAILPAFSRGGSTGELASGMVAGYNDFYASKGKKVTLSAIKVSELGGFMTAFNDWTSALLASDQKAKIKGAAGRSAAYAYADNKDLYDFASRVAALYPDDILGAKSRALMDVIANRLVVSNIAYTSTGSDKASHGLAIYLPGKGYNDKYDALAWTRDTRWGDFLKGMKDVAEPELGSGCVKPGPNASLDEIQAYISCLTASLRESGLSGL